MTNPDDFKYFLITQVNMAVFHRNEEVRRASSSWLFYVTRMMITALNDIVSYPESGSEDRRIAQEYLDTIQAMLEEWQSQK